MSRPKTFPGVNLNVQDIIPPAVAPAILDTLHAPWFGVFAEKGDPLEPFWGTGTEHATRFGALTFDKTGPFYNHQTLYAETAMALQPVWTSRLVPEDAEIGGFVLEMHWRFDSITQYQKNPDGTRIVTNGSWVPQTVGEGQPLLEQGIRLKFVVRALDSEEDFRALDRSTVVSGGTEWQVYPLFATKGRYAGAYMNRTGIRLYYSPSYDRTQVEDVQALTYRFQAIERAVTLTVPDAIVDRQNLPFHDVTFAPSSVDPDTNLDISLEATLDRQYITNDGDYVLPFFTQFYSENVQDLSAEIINVSEELEDLASPFLVNILAAVHPSGIEYDHLVIESSSSVIGVNANIYNLGGTNGTMTPATFNAQFERFVRGNAYTAVRDVLRYPITHLYDSGFPVAVKNAIPAAYSWSPLIKPDWTTQDVLEPANSITEDMSIGSSLRALVATNIESALYGTPCLRGAIWMQAGRLSADRNYRTLVPVGLQRLIQRCTYEGREYRSGVPAGSPMTNLTVIGHRTLNWTPQSDDEKQEATDNALNYVQYSDKAVVFMPGLRSVYPFQNSVISGDPFADAVVYIKLAILREWTKYAGSDEDLARQFTNIQSSIDNRIFNMFRGAIPSKTTITQSATSDALGYVIDFNVDLFGNVPKRRWNVTLRVQRQGNTVTVATV